MGGVSSAHPDIFASKERGNLVVTVKGPDGKGIPKTSIEVWGLRGGYQSKGRIDTNAAGQVKFTNLPVLHKGSERLPWYVKVYKEDHGPDTKPWNCLEVQKDVPAKLDGDKTAQVEVRLAPRPPVDKDACITSLKITAYSLPGVDHAPTRPEKGQMRQEKGKDLAEPALTSEGTLVLICGSPAVTLTIEGEKPPLLADWMIECVDEGGVSCPGSTPNLQVFDGGAGAWLFSGTPGLFRVVASLNKTSAALFVRVVKVTLKGAPVGKGADGMANRAMVTAKPDFDGDYKAYFAKIQLGEFTKDKASFQLDATIELSDKPGGGLSDPANVTRVSAWGLNHVRSNTSSASYEKGACKEAFKAPPPLLDTNTANYTGEYDYGTVPVVSDGKFKCMAFMWYGSYKRSRAGSTQSFSVWDSPAISFRARHLNNRTPQTSIDATIGFRMAVAINSSSWPGMVFVLGWMDWTYRLKGKVTIEGDDEKTEKVSFVPEAAAVSVGAWTPCDQKPAPEADCPIKAPVYIGGNAYEFQYS